MAIKTRCDSFFQNEHISPVLKRGILVVMGSIVVSGIVLLLLFRVQLLTWLGLGPIILVLLSSIWYFWKKIA